MAAVAARQYGVVTRAQLLAAGVGETGIEERPKVNTRIEGYEVDFAWPEAKLIIEADGFAAHRTRTAFERDRLRDRRLARAGFQTLRVTSRSLAYEDEIVADVEAFLSRSRVSSKPPTRKSTSSASSR